MRLLSILLVVVCLFACKSDPKSKYPKLDLMQYGFPLEIYAPEGAVVEKSDLGVMSDVTIKGEDGYYVQIFGSEATTTDATAVKNAQLSDVKAGPYFSKVVEEYDDGFIYERKIDERINYDFRLIKVQGDKEYIYQTGLVGTYSEQQVRDMMEAVR